MLGAALTPWLFWATQWLSHHVHWRILEDMEFHRVFDRSVLIAALLLLWPTYRSLELRSVAELGLTRDPRRGRHLMIGFLSAFTCMAAFGVLLFWLGVFRLKVEPPWTALFKVALTAVTVSLLEEWLFRGMILGFFRRALMDWPAVACTSALFSIVHFLKPPADDVGTIDWLSGFRALPECFGKFSEPALLAAGFTTLFMIGMALGWGVLRTRALWLSIGLHAGWVFGKFGFTKLTKRSITDTMPWVGEDLIVGFGALAVVVCSWLVAWLLTRNADSQYRHPGR